MALIKAEAPSFAAGELAPEMAARVDVAKYQVGLRLGRNVIGLRQGGVTNRPGTECIGQVRDSLTCRLIPFQFNAEQAHALEFAAVKFRVIQDGGYVTTAAQTITSFTPGPPLTIGLTAHGLQLGQHLYFVGLGGLLDSDGLSGVNGKTFIVSSIVDADHVQVQNMRFHNVDLSSLTAYTSGGTVEPIFELTTPYSHTELADIRYEQSADVMYLSHHLHPLMKLERHAANDWTLSVVDFETHCLAPANVDASGAGGFSGTDTYSYHVTGFNDDTGQESLVVGSAATVTNYDLTLDGAYITVTWDAPSAVTGSDLPTRYIVYKESAGLYGYIGSTVDLTFKDNNIDPDLGDSPPVNSDPFDGTGNYPTALGFFEQRLYGAGTDNKPNGVFGSRSGDFENMNYSRPLKADDAISFGISARQVNRVLHLVPMHGLLALTSDTVFKIDGGSGEPISPNAIVVRAQVYRGSANCRPVVIDDAVLYVTAKGSRLRNLGYQIYADIYQGTDLTIYSSHFFEGRAITEMAWCEHPHSAVFCVTDDGLLLCMTWMPEQEVFGWTLLETDGTVQSICAVTENGRDRLYAVVARVNYAPGSGGGTFSFVERIALPYETEDDIASAWYLDCAISYSGDPATKFAGLDHLEGRTVNALVDGNVVSGLKVTNGKVSLTDAGSVVTVGIPYVSLLKTLTPTSPQRPTQGRLQSITGAILRLLNTRGVKAGVDHARLEPVKPLYEPTWDEPAELLTGDYRVGFDTGWTSAIGVYVQQDQPLPMTVLGVYADLGIGG